MSESRCETDEYGNKCWYNDNGELHRIDGPAVEWGNGNRYWYFNNKLHRTNGPAIEWSDGGKSWCVNGMIHRIDGPAVESFDGYKEWWIKGVRCTEEEFKEITEYEKFKQELGELFKI
jgi:hypothetical protein